ncbi:putative protein arginine N-methyltransferase 6 [Zea mays]|uniref:Protein arginine N-methyltransferase domain-containing protein n=1 Tax=Zea mays TaxID=4577 RepID=A0A1D6KSE7_MAIZE|nr:putative protein arginine N-methyltransferase 6 [Zea mays]
MSLLCSQVYAVDASDIAFQAMEIVRENELSDKVVVLHGRIEDVDIEEKVDVIISEWMGYMLLYESMLGSVIFARDKWLKPGGLILPSHASLYMAPVTNSQRYHDSIYFWRDVYGIKMSSMMPLAKLCAFMEPSVETISGENVLTWPAVVAQVDCYTIQAQKLETITAAFKFTSMLQGQTWCSSESCFTKSPSHGFEVTSPHFRGKSLPWFIPFRDPTHVGASDIVSTLFISLHSFQSMHILLSSCFALGC